MCCGYRGWSGSLRRGRLGGRWSSSLLGRRIGGRASFILVWYLNVVKGDRDVSYFVNAQDLAVQPSQDLRPPITD